MEVPDEPSTDLNIEKIEEVVLKTLTPGIKLAPAPYPSVIFFEEKEAKNKNDMEGKIVVPMKKSTVQLAKSKEEFDHIQEEKEEDERTRKKYEGKKDVLETFSRLLLAGHPAPEEMKKFTDDEIMSIIRHGLFPAYKLEKLLNDCDRAISIRLEYLFDYYSFYIQLQLSKSFSNSF